MDNIIINSGKAVNLNQKLTALPHGVEYEQLVRNLQNHTKEKYNLKDLRSNNETFSLDMIKDEDNDKKTVILSPGMLIEYENPQNGLLPHPSEGPYSTGLIWE